MTEMEQSYGTEGKIHISLHCTGTLFLGIREGLPQAAIYRKPLTIKSSIVIRVNFLQFFFVGWRLSLAFPGSGPRTRVFSG
jgi:hypothetical protein